MALRDLLTRDDLPEEVREAIETALDQHEQAEKELRETRDLFRTMLESSGDGSLVVDGGSTVIHSNERLAELFDLRREPGQPLAAAELLGAVAQHMEDPEAFKAKLERLRESHVRDFDRLRLRDGRVIGLYSYPRLKDEKLSGRVWSFRDITDRARDEEALRNAQKLESLGVLAGGVAHDFNNLLVGMLGHSSLALDKLPTASAARGNIEKVVHCAERAADLARQMLAYSGHGHFMVRSIDLNELIRDNLHLLEAALPRNVSLTAIPSERPAAIDVDVGQIQQVVMNLVQNAAEALEEGPGSVTITAGLERVSDGHRQYARFTATELPPGLYVSLVVRDDGCGMSDETLTKIFDPFFTTKPPGQGTGLGLEISRRLVRQYDGEVSVQSRPGRTVFEVSLVAAAAEDETPER
jgi:two-component system cell cycle sensor histidine kinase/response regulator CckA